MPYNVRAGHIAKDIDDEVQKEILEFLKAYDFPYVTTVANKSTLRDLFIEHTLRGPSSSGEKRLTRACLQLSYACAAYNLNHMINGCYTGQRSPFLM